MKTISIDTVQIIYTTQQANEDLKKQKKMSFSGSTLGTGDQGCLNSNRHKKTRVAGSAISLCQILCQMSCLFICHMTSYIYVDKSIALSTYVILFS